MKTEIIKLITQWPSLGSAGRRTHCDRGATISSQGWYTGRELGPMEAVFKERRELCDMDGVMEELKREFKGVTVKTYFFRRLGRRMMKDIKSLGQDRL